MTYEELQAQRFKTEGRAPTMREALELVLQWIDDNCETTGFAPIEALADAALAAPVAEPVAEPSHFDDAAVDRFSDALKVKMKIAREKGRHGWHDQRLCSEQALQQMLTDHMAKGDPVDVGNFAMMLWNRGEKVAPSPPVKVPLLTAAEILAIMRGGNNCNYNDEGEHVDFARAIEQTVRQKVGIK